MVCDRQDSRSFGFPIFSPPLTTLLGVCILTFPEHGSLHFRRLVLVGDAKGAVTVRKTGRFAVPSLELQESFCFFAFSVSAV